MEFTRRFLQLSDIAIIPKIMNYIPILRFVNIIIDVTIASAGLVTEPDLVGLFLHLSGIAIIPKVISCIPIQRFVSTIINNKSPLHQTD